MAEEVTPGSPAPVTPATGSPAPATQAPSQDAELRVKLDNTISQVNGLKAKLADVEREKAELAAGAEAARTLRVESSVKDCLLDAASTLPSAVAASIKQQMEGMTFDSADQAQTVYKALKGTATAAAGATAQGSTPAAPTPPVPAPKSDDGGAGSPAAPTETDPSKMTAQQKIAAGYEKNSKASAGKFV